MTPLSRPHEQQVGAGVPSLSVDRRGRLLCVGGFTRIGRSTQGPSVAPTDWDDRGVGVAGELLQRAARAWPVADQGRQDGWWLRHTDVGPWWSGAVLAHGAGDRLEERIAAAERFYTRHDTWPRFQVCPDCPADLDTVLETRGYGVECAVALMTATAPCARSGGSGWDVRVEPVATPAWLAVRAATSRAFLDTAGLVQRLHAVTRPQAFVTVMGPDRSLGIGRAVADTGWTGVFDMATVPEARGRGVARAVLAAITDWAAGQATQHLYLQVETSTTAALALYRSSGFAVAARYHYRTLRPGPADPWAATPRLLR